MLSSWYPITTMEILELNTFWDGVFHLATYLFVLAELFILWRSARRKHFQWSTRELVGLILVGFGLFNLIEGIVDHAASGSAPCQRERRPLFVALDIGFLLWGAAMDAGGFMGMGRRSA